MHMVFRKFAEWVSCVVGSPWTFMAAVAAVAIWAITGPIFGFSNTWQLVINTATTIVTFLMVFLIQNTQNRDARAIHLKLDELIRSIGNARTNLVDLEDLTDEELDQLYDEFHALQQEALGRQARKLQRGEAEPDRRPDAAQRPQTGEQVPEAADRAGLTRERVERETVPRS
jgi:low affinity Fe/Cu permease